MKIPYVALAVNDERHIKEILHITETIMKKGNYVLGEQLEKFEKSFASFCEVNYAVGVNSGTDALFLALEALGIGQDSEVITVGNSFIATVGAIVQAGAKPVIVDVNYDDMLINTDLIEEKITDRTRAIMPVHLAGLPCHMEAIKRISQKYNLYIIEDACQSVGATYKGEKTGSLGHIGCFSFHPLKNLGTLGDGGIITTDDSDLYSRLKCLRNHGLNGRDTAKFFGYNSRLDNVQAGILDYRLSMIDETTETKKRLAGIYDDLLFPLKEKGFIDYYLEDDERTNVYHLFIIKTGEREGLKRYLENNGIETKVHYPIPIHKQEAFIDCFGETELSVTEKLSDEILSLPVWKGMDDSMVGEVCNKIRSYFN